MQDIVTAVDNIAKYVSHGRDEFFANELIQSWVVRQLELIGEAVNAVPDDILERAENVPWNEIRGMRHVLIHDYFGVDLEVVWDTASTDVPAVGPQIAALLDGLEDDVPGEPEDSPEL